MGVKSTITTWENAKKAIRDEFAPRPPAHRIYQMIFETKQDANTPTGLFIAQKRALLAQVTPPDSESRQLDFLYGLLRQEIKDKIPRTSIATFYELLAKARDIEGTLQERKKEKVRPNDENGRNRCEYCHNFGHTMKECRKKAKRAAQQTAEPNNVPQAANNTNFSCYGCGHPGVIRRNCPKCNNKPVSATPDVQFCLLDVKPLGRPAVKIQIHGVPGTAYIDSGARTSLASAQLYHILTERGHKFLPTTVQLVQAGGSSTLTNVKTATLPVKLQGKEIETTFITIPDAHETTTLLGIDFLRKAGLVINYAHSRWYFSGQRHQTYGFVAKDQTQKDTQMAAMQTDSIVPFQSTVPQQRTPQRVDAVMQMETDTPTQVDKIPNQIAATPRKPKIVSPNLEDIFAECRLPTLLSPITTPCNDTVSELLDGYGPPPPVRTSVVARPMFIPTPDQLPFTTSRHQYIMHNAAMDVEFEWEQPLSQMEEGLFPVVEMSMLEVIEVKLRQSSNHIISEASTPPVRLTSLPTPYHAPF
jgi:hypothetical protein